MEKSIAIVGGGTMSVVFIKEIRKCDYTIGVDRGAYWLIRHNITPHLAIGDFDSVSSDEFQEIKKKSKKTKQYSPEKNYTDMELAIKEALKQNPEEVRMYGALGSRLDHSLGTIHLLEFFLKNHINACIRNETNEIVLTHSDIHLKKNTNFTYFSILPYTKRILVTLQGCKYPVQRKIIVRGQTLGISNEVLGDETVIVIHEGIALVIQSRD